MKAITFHAAATLEMIEAAQYYESRSPGLGSALLDEIGRSLARIAENPEACQYISRSIRRKVLRRFPYNLIYAVGPDQIRLLALAHQKRRPFYWRKRLTD